MKNRLSVAAVMLLCLALVLGFACGEGEEEEEGVKELKMGIGIPLSGLVGAAVGVPAKGAFELAAEKVGEFTVAGQKYRWNLIFEDNDWTSAGGVASATKFIYDHGVKFMHQAGCSPAMAAQPLCEEAGVLLDIAGCGLEAFGPDKPHTFEATPTWLVHSAAFFHWLTTAHPEAKRFAVASSDDETGHALSEAAVTAAEHFGLEVVIEEFVPLGTTELYPVATKVMTKNPDLVICSTLTLRPMWDMGYEGLHGYPYWYTSAGEQAGWGNVQGRLIYTPHPYGEWVTEAVTQLAAEYQERYGAELIPSAFWAATVIYVLTSALEQAGTVDDVEKIIEILETGTFDTPVGPLEYGGEELVGVSHLLMWPAPIGEIRGQELHILAVIPADEAEALAAEIFGK